MAKVFASALGIPMIGIKRFRVTIAAARLRESKETDSKHRKLAAYIWTVQFTAEMPVNTRTRTGDADLEAAVLQALSSAALPQTLFAVVGLTLVPNPSSVTAVRVFTPNPTKMPSHKSTIETAFNPAFQAESSPSSSIVSSAVINDSTNG